MPSASPTYRLRRSPPAIAVVGATGAVGVELLTILAERDFPVRAVDALCQAVQSRIRKN